MKTGNTRNKRKGALREESGNPEEIEGWSCPAIPVWKRPLDWLLVLGTLPLWLPVAFLCSLWINLVSKGDVLFRQERVGRGGKRFTIFKFRTMRVGAATKVHDQYLHELIESDQPMTKLDGSDARLIPGGKLIRAAGLDELPQLINVLLGDMSIVGPRPCTPTEMEKYKPSFRRRFNGLPGLTGSWQVNGKNKTTFRRMIALDVQYLRTASLWKDLVIMVRTGPALLGQIAELGRRMRPARTQTVAEDQARFARKAPTLYRNAPQKPREASPIIRTAQEFIRKTQRLTEAPSGHTEPVRFFPPDR